LISFFKKMDRWKFRNFFIPTSTKKNTKLISDNYDTAKCCNPIPGDEIIGIEEKGKLIIHRKDCKLLKKDEQTKKKHLNLHGNYIKQNHFSQR